MDEVEELVARAAGDDQAAWSLLVERFSGLVWSVARSVGLAEADAADVCQTTWMRLAEHLADVQETSRVGSWLATTARREAIRVSRRGSRQVLVDPWDWLQREDDAFGAPEALMLATERRLSVQLAVAELPERCRRLLLALAADPPTSYVEISTSLDLPMGSIGPTRSRCLQRLAQLLEQYDATAETEEYSERSST